MSGRRQQLTWPALRLGDVELQRGGAGDGEAGGSGRDSHRKVVQRQSAEAPRGGVLVVAQPYRRPRDDLLRLRYACRKPARVLRCEFSDRSG